MQGKSIVLFKPDYCCVYIDNGDVKCTLMCWWDYYQKWTHKASHLCSTTARKHLPQTLIYCPLFSPPSISSLLPIFPSSPCLPFPCLPLAYLQMHLQTHSQANVSLISINVPSLLAWVFILLLLGWMFYRYQLD